MESRVDNKKINTVQITNLEEFFSTSCKDEIFAALDLFPDEKSVIIDYNDLEMFNPDIADALLAKPNETLEVATDAIINIDPQRRDIGLNVRFKNVRNVVHLRNLKSEYIGKKDATFETCGVYHIIGDSIIELITPSSGEKTYYRMLNNKQVMLSNKEGDINKGSLAEHYILNKK